MATLSSHLLNSVDGTHASGVKVIINQINSSGIKRIFFETETDDGGRILKDFELSNAGKHLQIHSVVSFPFKAPIYDNPKSTSSFL